MKQTFALILALVMAFSLCACGSQTKAPAQEAAPEAPAAENAPAAEAAPVVGKDTAILVTSGEPYRFFAQSKQSCAGDDNLVLSNVYDCLLRLEADGSLSPALAESYEVSEDGLTYTFHLRKGVKFHNGTEMTAQDVKFTFDYGFEGPIGTALFVNYQECEIVDDYTVKIHLSAPYAAFPYGAASRLGGIASKAHFDAVGDDGYLADPIGTGPYKYVEHVTGDHTTLTANEDYWGGVPAVKNVVIQTVADMNTMILGLQNGDYDVVRNPGIDICTRLTGDTVAWDSANSAGYITLLLTDWQGPCMDKNFRKAVQAGVNKENINVVMFSGYAEAIDINMCSSYGGFVTEADGVEVVSYDPEAAAKYLAESNYNGEEFAITVEPAYEQVAKMIQADMLELGINCVVNCVDNATRQDAFGTRDYQAIIINNLSSLVDADSMMTLHRLDRPKWNEANRLFARDEEIVELLQAARGAQGDARKPLYTEACNIITEEAYDVPLVNDLTVLAYSTALAGVEAHCLGNYYFFNWSWVK